MIPPHLARALTDLPRRPRSDADYQALIAENARLRRALRQAEAVWEQATIDLLAVTRDITSSCLASELAKAQAAINSLAGKTITINLRPNDPPNSGAPAQVGGGPGPLSPGGRAIPALMGV